MTPVSTAAQKGALAQCKLLLRGPAPILVNAGAGEKIEINITTTSIAKHTDPLFYTLYSPKGEVMVDEKIESGKSASIFQAAKEAGTYKLSVKGDIGAVYNSVRVDASNRYMVLSTPVHLFCDLPSLYFYVPKGVQKFSVLLRSGGKEQQGGVEVFTPAGAQAASGFTEWSEKARRSALGLEVNVPAGLDDSIWKAVIKPKDNISYQDLWLSFSDEIPPYVSCGPERMLKPAK
jgi:hypothetical protein